MLCVFLALLLGPIRSQAVRYGVGPAEATWIGLRNALKGPVRVGVQIGHEAAADQPEELAALRWNFGGHSASLDEVTVNRQVAADLQRILGAHGIIVELLPATIPIAYNADLLVSVHADSVDDTSRNGYKSAHFHPPRNDLEPLLKELVDAVFLERSPLRDDSINVSGGMHYYYAFSGEYRHSVHPRTPALIVELGYISNAADRAWLLAGDEPARLLADGVLAFLRSVQRIPPDH